MTLDKYDWHFYVAFVVFTKTTNVVLISGRMSHTVFLLHKLSESEGRNKLDLKMSHWQRIPTTIVKLSKRNA